MGHNSPSDLSKVLHRAGGVAKVSHSLYFDFNLSEDKELIASYSDSWFVEVFIN
jgi:hypothetical protein